MIDLSNLKRLGELTALGRAPRGAVRELKADSKKNRRALAEACLKGKLEELEALVELGVAVEFLEESFPNDLAHPPLRICAARQFDAGMEALLAAGAVDGAVEPGGAPVWGHSALALATEERLPSAFQALWPDAPTEFKAKAVASIDSLVLWEAMEACSAVDACKADDIARIVAKSIERSARDISRRSFESALAAFSRAPATMPRAELSATIWHSALKRGLAWMLEALANADIPLADTFNIEPRMLSIDHAPDHYTRNTQLGASRSYSVRREWKTPEKRIEVPALILPFLFNPSYSSRELWCPIASLPEAYEALLASPWARGIMVDRHSLPFFKHLKNLGRDLSAWTDSEGNTPLHSAVKKYGFSKSQLLDWVQLQPEWFTAKNNHGKIPLDHFKPGDSRLSEWTSVVEKRLLKASSKGGGHKPPSAPKRRL